MFGEMERATVQVSNAKIWSQNAWQVFGTR